MKKRKENYKGEKDKFSLRDFAQSPPYAVNPIQEIIPEGFTIWEPACGKGYLSKRLSELGYAVLESDIQRGQNFFEYEPEESWDCIITNPPFSTKVYWIERCYDLEKPFALLMPLETLGIMGASKWFRKYGVELIIPTRRIDFEMPNKGYTKNGAHFHTIWFTWGFGIGSDITYVDLIKEPEICPVVNIT